ncbi:MAG TPA: hypothetical protein DCR93_19085 [Cytophagales bacterium]|nr:hypothetical protein [Cytophagales bacterium]
MNLSNNTDVGFRFSDAELNATYVYTIKSSGGTDSVAGNGLITSSSLLIGGISVTDLEEGTLTLTVSLTDENGNGSNPEFSTADYAKSPVVTTNVTTDILLNGATFNGTVNGQGASSTRVQFEYSTSSDFSNSSLTSPVTITSAEPEAVTATVDGLTEDTNYFVRVTAFNGNGGVINGGADTFTTLLNLEPELEDIALTTPEDSAFSFTYEMFDVPFFSPDGSSLSSISIESLPTEGSLTLNGAAVTLNQVISGSEIPNLSYTPDQDFNGEDAFRWNAEAVDILAIDEATVEFTVTAVNDAPTISSIDTRSGKETEPISGVEFTITDVDDDANNLQVSFASSNILVIDPTGITMTGNGENRELTLTSSEEQGYGESEITVTVSDGELETSTTFTVIFGISARPPVVYDLFTPNGDGVNDVWIIENLQSYERFQVVAFDPETQTQLFNLDAEGTGDLGDEVAFWDGTSGGIAVADGAYGYVIILTTEDGATEKLTGFVVVQRDFFND